MKILQVGMKKSDFLDFSLQPLLTYEHMSTDSTTDRMGPHPLRCNRKGTHALVCNRMGPTQYFLSALISKQQTPRGYLNGRRGELVVTRSSIRRE